MNNMELIKIKWEKRDYEELRKKLYELQDENYKNFCKKIIKDDSIIGIRIPILRKISKEISKGNYESFLKISNPICYEEKMLYGLVICNIEKYSLDIFNYIDEYILKINNWSLCDTFCISLKIVKKYKTEFFEYILKNIKTNNNWIKRFCFVLLLNYYIEKKYIKVIFELCNKYNTNEYYVEMAIAWLITECFIKEEKITTKFLKENKLGLNINKKILKKINESNKINKEKYNFIRKEIKK